MKVIKVNCKNCPGKKSTYNGIEFGHSFSCYFDKNAIGFIGAYKGHLGYGAAYSLPEIPPDFCPLEDYE